MGKLNESKRPNIDIKNNKRIYKSVKKYQDFVTPEEFYKDKTKVWQIIYKSMTRQKYGQLFYVF